MNIAQSQIAGEDTLRLHDIHAAELKAALAETRGEHVADIPAPTRLADIDLSCLQVDLTHLPYKVLRAIRRAQSLTTLPARARLALAAIALTVDQHAPLNSVFAGREYLARRAGQSSRTLKRAMNDLEAAGLIRVDGQGRKADGRLAGAYLYLTVNAADMLGYFEPVKAAVRQVSAETESPQATSFGQPSDTLSDGSIYGSYQFPLSQKRQPGDLPEDVKPLQSMGFSKFHIFALMRSARVDHGKRLGDVVAVAGDLIAKAKHPRAYLASLLRAETDFGFLARQRRADAVRRAEAQAVAQANAELQSRIAGQVFYDRDAAKRYEVSTDGAQLFVRDPEEGADRMAAPGWIAGLAKGLRTAQLVPANAWLDEQFAERLQAGLANRPTAAAAWSGGTIGLRLGSVGAGDAGGEGVPGVAQQEPAPGMHPTSADYLRPVPRERSAAFEACMAALRRTVH